MTYRKLIACCFFFITLVASFSNGFAQSFPQKQIRMVVPFPPGSATDMAARIMGQQIGSALGQPVVIDNKPGAFGSIAAMEVIRSNPDGYTLLFSSNSAISSNVALLKKIPYDPTKDFTPVVGIGENMLVLVTKSNSQFKNLPELITYAKQNPGKLSAGYGSSSSQVCIAMLNKLGGIEIMSVPYKGIPLAINDVMGDTLDFTFADIGNALAQTKGGTMKSLGVTAPKRSTLAPEWPAIAETLPGFDITAWFAIVGPAGMPKEAVNKISSVAIASLKKTDVKEKLAAIGLAVMPLTPDQLQSFISTEITKWTRLVKEANIQAE